MTFVDPSGHEIEIVYDYDSVTGLRRDVYNRAQDKQDFNKLLILPDRNGALEIVARDGKLTDNFVFEAVDGSDGQTVRIVRRVLDQRYEGGSASYRITDETMTYLDLSVVQGWRVDPRDIQPAHHVPTLSEDLAKIPGWIRNTTVGGVESIMGIGGAPTYGPDGWKSK